MAVPCGPSNPTPRPSKLSTSAARRLRAHRRLLDLGALGALRRFGRRAAAAGLFFGFLGGPILVRRRQSRRRVVRHGSPRSWRHGRSRGGSDEISKKPTPNATMPRASASDINVYRRVTEVSPRIIRADPTIRPNFLLLASHFSLLPGVTSPRNPWRCGSWLGELWSAVRSRRFSSSASARSIARRRRPARSSWPAIRTTTRARSRSAISATSGRPTKTARASCV